MGVDVLSALQEFLEFSLPFDRQQKPNRRQIDRRPPTQSQKPNTRSLLIPKAAILSSWVDTAQKCSATAASPSSAATALRAVAALVMVSIVVKVFEQTMKSVVSIGTRFNVSPRSAPSTLATVCSLR